MKADWSGWAEGGIWETGGWGGCQGERRSGEAFWEHTGPEEQAGSHMRRRFRWGRHAGCFVSSPYIFGQELVPGSPKKGHRAREPWTRSSFAGVFWANEGD